MDNCTWSSGLDCGLQQDPAHLTMMNCNNNLTLGPNLLTNGKFILHSRFSEFPKLPSRN